MIFVHYGYKHCVKRSVCLVSMSSEVSKLKERVTRLERKVRKISDALALLPETVDPLSWKQFDLLDKQILTQLLSNKPYSTVELAHKIKNVHRTKVWRRLKKIQKVSLKLKGDSIVVFDPSTKKWALNTEEFEFKELASS